MVFYIDSKSSRKEISDIKHTIKKVKGQPIEWKKIISNYIWHGPLSRIYKEHLQFKNNKTTRLEEDQNLSGPRIFLGWVWWCTAIIPAFERLMQEDCCEFEVILGYIVSSRLALNIETPSQKTISPEK